MNDFVIQLDEEVEGMQATICALQDELKTTKTRCTQLEEENRTLQNGGSINRDLKQQPNGLLAHDEPLIEENKYEGRTMDVKPEMERTDHQLMNDDEERSQPPPLVTDKKENIMEDDERTIHSNGDSNMTDESEELYHSVQVATSF